MPKRREPPGRRRSSRLFLFICTGSAFLLVLAIAANVYLTRPRLDQEVPLDHVAAPVAQAPTVAPRCNPALYGATLTRDAQKYGVPVPDVQALRQPLSGGNELHAPTVLKPHGMIETPHLRLTLSIDRVRTSTDGSQGFRAETLVLSITNKSNVPLVYRVRTAVEDASDCIRKPEIAHNAIALRPHQTLRRSECLAGRKASLVVKRADAYEISELGYHYLSRLMPEQGGPFEMRVDSPHDPGKTPPCRILPWRGLDGSQTDIWHAVIDFHARHDCDAYSIPSSYAPWTQAGVLPVCE